MENEFTVALAPLAGITDRSFRKICRKMGADITTTEMVSIKGLYYKDEKSFMLMDISQDEPPVNIQLFGSDPDMMAYATSLAAEKKPAYIDINMGCPMPKIVNNGDGSALMKNINLASKVIKSAVRASSIPVSVKFRKGYDSENINCVEFAKMCQESGATSICVHGRTREQLYSGKVDYDSIAAVKNAVKIRVFGNGDIFTAESAFLMHEKTGCDGVYVARGALGNPFIFAQIKEYGKTGVYKEYSVEERLNTAILQARAMLEYKPERILVSEMRKHIAWYMRGMKNSAECKLKIFMAKSLDEIEVILRKYIDGGEEGYDRAKS